MDMFSRRLIVAILWEFCLLLTVCEPAKYNAENFIQSTLTVKPYPTIPEHEAYSGDTNDVHHRKKRQDVEDEEDLDNIPGVIASTFKNELTTQIFGKQQVITETRVQHYFPEQTFTGAAENPIEIQGAVTSSSVKTYSLVDGDNTRFITSTFFTYFYTKGASAAGNADNTANKEIPGVITSSAISTFARRRGGSTIQVTSTFYTYYYTQANVMNENGEVLANVGGISTEESESDENNNDQGLSESGITRTFTGIPGAITSTIISSYSTVVGDITRFITETRLKYFLPDTVEDKATEKLNIEGAIRSSIISTYTKVNAGRTRLLRSTFYTYYHTEAIVGNKDYDYYYDDNENGNGESGATGNGANGNNGGGSSSGSNGGGSGSNGGGSGSNGGGSSGSNGGGGSSGSNGGGGSNGNSASGNQGVGGANGNDGSSEGSGGLSGSEEEFGAGEGSMITSTFFSTVTKVLNGKTRTLIQTNFLYYPNDENLVENTSENFDLSGAITSTAFSTYTKMVNGVARRIKSTFYTYYFTNDGSDQRETGGISKPSIVATTAKGFSGALTSTIVTTYNTVIHGRTRLVTETRLKYFIADETLTQFGELNKKNKNLITSTFFSTFTKSQNRQKMFVTSTLFEYYKEGGEMEKIEEMEMVPTRSNEVLSSEDMEGFITSTLLSTITRTLNGGRRKTFTKTKLMFYPITETITEKVNKPMSIPGAISSSAVSTFTHVEGGKTKIIKSTFYTYYFNAAEQTVFGTTSEREIPHRIITSTFYSTFAKRIRGKTQMVTSTFTSVYEFSEDEYYDYEEEIHPTSTLDRFVTSTAFSKYTEIISGKPKIITSKILTFYDEEGNEEVQSTISSKRIRKSHFIRPTTSTRVRIVTKAVGESALEEEDFSSTKMLISSISPMETPFIDFRVRTSIPKIKPSITIDEYDYTDDTESTSSSISLPQENVISSSSLNPENVIVSKTTRIVTSPIRSSSSFISSSRILEPSLIKSTVFSTITKIKDGTTKFNTVVSTIYFPVTVTIDQPNTSESKPHIMPTLANPNYKASDKNKDVTSTIYSTYESVIKGSTKYFTKTYIRHYQKSSQIENESGEDENYSKNEENESENSNEKAKTAITSTFIKTYKTRYGGKKERLITSTVISTYNLKDDSDYYYDYGQDSDYGKVKDDQHEKDYQNIKEENEDNQDNEDNQEENENKNTFNGDVTTITGIPGAASSIFYETLTSVKHGITMTITRTKLKYFPTKYVEEKGESDYYYDDESETGVTSTFIRTYAKTLGKRTNYVTSTFISEYPNIEEHGVKEKLSTSKSENSSPEVDYYEEYEEIPSEITSTFYKTYYRQKGSQTDFITSTLTSIYPIAGHSGGQSSKVDSHNSKGSKAPTHSMEENEHHDEDENKVSSEESNTNDENESNTNDENESNINDENESNTNDENESNAITSTFIMTHTKRFQGHTKLVTSTYTSVYKKQANAKGTEGISNTKIDNNEEDRRNENKYQNHYDINGNNFAVTSTFVKTFSKVIGRKTNFLTSTIISRYYNQNPEHNHKITTGLSQHKVKHNYSDSQLEYYDYDVDRHLLVTSTFMSTLKKTQQGKTRYVTSTFTSLYPIIDEEADYQGEHMAAQGKGGKVIKYTQIKGGLTKYITSSFPWVSPSDISTELQTHEQTENGDYYEDYNHQALVTSTFIHTYPRVISGKTRYFTRTITSFFPDQLGLHGKETDNSNEEIDVNNLFGDQGAITSTFYSTYPTIIRGHTRFLTKTKISYYPIKGIMDSDESNYDEVSSTFTKVNTLVKDGKTRYLTKTLVSYYPKQVNAIGITSPEMFKGNLVTSTFYSIYSVLADDSMEYSYQTELVYYPKHGRPITQIVSQDDDQMEDLNKLNAVVSTFVITHTNFIPGATNLITSSWVSKYPIQHITDISNPLTFIKKYPKATNVNKKQIKSTFTKLYTYTHSNDDYDDESDTYGGPVTTIYGIPGAITSTFYRTFTTIKNGRTLYKTETRLLFYPTEGQFFNDKIEQTVASVVVSTYDVNEPGIPEFITSTFIRHNNIKQTRGQEITSTFFTTYTTVKGGRTKYSTETKMKTYSRS